MKVKICAITDPKDAEFAAHAGADTIGMIFYSRSKRHVQPAVAKIIVQAAKQAGAEPVGVFVDQTAEQILAICEQTGLRTIQLHGPAARQALPQLQSAISIIYAIAVDKNGKAAHIPALPPTVIPLFDHAQGGSGQPFDWKAFTPPKHASWILAGGLNAQNVRQAISLLKPSMVDVAGSVEFPNSVRKDPLLVRAFIQAAKQQEEK